MRKLINKVTSNISSRIHEAAEYATRSVKNMTGATNKAGNTAMEISQVARDKRAARKVAQEGAGGKPIGEGMYGYDMDGKAFDRYDAKSNRARTEKLRKEYANTDFNPAQTDTDMGGNKPRSREGQKGLAIGVGVLGTIGIGAGIGASATGTSSDDEVLRRVRAQQI